VWGPHIEIQFAELFRMTFKEAMVQDLASWNDSQSHWNIMFSRIPNDSEEESAYKFLATLA